MYNFHTHKTTDVNWLFKDNSDLIKEIKQSDLKESKVECKSLKGFKSIGSYNWPPRSTPEKPIVLLPGRASCLSKNLVTQQLT